MKKSHGPLCVLVIGLAVASIARADGVDELIAKRMQERHICGLSLAVIHGGKIVKSQGYGFTEKNNKTAVTSDTLFQAGSISKAVAAAGALHLVDQNRLPLDGNVNAQLRTWKVPENEFTKEKKVTLRNILSHCAGLTVHGFPGYAVDSRVPSLVQVLNGTKPANTEAIRVNTIPGSKERYSGGGYTVLQQLIIDVTGEPFPRFMHDTVLEPLGMTNSTYEEPLPSGLSVRTATGYYADGKAVAGRWHVYPEMAAAGLWTTAADLARFVIGIQESVTGKSNLVISQPTARQMLTKQKDNAGLGLFIEGEGTGLVFMHNGRDAGFDAEMVASANRGFGVVIMINANDNSGVCKEIVQAIVEDSR